MDTSRLLRLFLGLVAVASLGDGAMDVKVDRYRYMDPMFECVRVVLAQRGDAYDPAYIQSISGMAFRMAGPCPCAPTCSTAMEPAELLGVLGYETTKIGLESIPKEKLDEAVAATVVRIKDEIRAGRAAIVWHAFTNAEFDVVSGFDEEKKVFLGYGSYRGNDQGPANAPETRLGTCGEICPVIGALLVGAKTKEFDARAAELAALVEAVRHARAPRDRFLAEIGEGEIPWRFRNGLACYEVWIRHFATNPQKVPDGGGDHYPLNVYASTRQAAPVFLRLIAPKYPEGQVELLAAANCFEQDAAALAGVKKLFGGWGPDRWKESDPEKAKQAVTLLTEAKGHYGEGIDHLAKALAAIDPERAAMATTFGRVWHQNGRTWIHDVPPLRFHQNQDNTYCGALAQAMQRSEQPYTYSDLMGLSGLAFRFRYSNGKTKTGFCPSSAIGEMPDEQKALAKRTGWRTTSAWQEVKDDPEGIRRQIVAAIDAGKPVLCYPPVWNVGLIYGYEDEGRMLQVSDYLGKEHPSCVPLAKMGPMREVLAEWRQPMPLGEALREVLAEAVTNWRREKHDGGLAGREYWYGKAAFDAWLADLAGYDALSEAQTKGLRSVDGWLYHCLWDARKAAIPFLRDWSCAMPGARGELAKIADIYQAEVAALDPLVEAKYAGDKSGHYLSPEERQQEIEILGKVRELDERAMVAIDALLNPKP